MGLWYCGVLGGVFSLVGAAVGLDHSLSDRRSVPCPRQLSDAFAAPAGDCWIHPHAFEGGALVLISLMFAVLMGAVLTTAAALLSRTRPGELPGRL